MPSAPTSTPHPADASGNPWPYALIGSLVLGVLGTATLVTIAVTHRTELVAPDYYDQEMRFQTRLDQLRRTEPFADRIAVRHVEGQGIALELPAEHAAGKATGTLTLYRPSEAGADRSFPLALNAAGHQLVPTADLTPGLWKVRVHWRVADLDYFADRKLVISGGGRRS